MRKLKVLIADDSIALRYVLSDIIKRLGHEHFEVSNGQQAIDALEKEDFDVIFMDIEMPEMTGIEATHYIRTKMTPPKSEIKIIALTAYDQQFFRERYKDAAVNEILSKPYSPDKIKSLLELIV
jgi:CheY-like chemotaxis protein